MKFLRKTKQIIGAFPWCLWQQDGVKGVDYAKPRWFFCRQQQANKSACSSQCQVCVEDEARMRTRAEGQVPQ